MKRAGILLVVLSFLRLFGGGLQGGVSEEALIVGTLLLVGGLIVWSLERIREVLVETRELARASLAIDAAESDDVP